MKRSPFVFNLTRVVAGVVLPARFDVRVRGLEHLPERGPALLIPKHQRWWDVPLLGHYMPRPLHFLAKEELFRSPPARWLISRLGGIPVDRRKPLKSLSTFRSLLPLIREQSFLVLFPEGTYFPGAMGPGKWRLVQMILSLQKKRDLPAVSFIPLGIHYRKAGTGIRMLVEMHIGEPLQGRDPAAAEAFTAELLDRVRDLSGL